MWCKQTAMVEPTIAVSEIAPVRTSESALSVIALNPVDRDLGKDAARRSRCIFFAAVRLAVRDDLSVARDCPPAPLANVVTKDDNVIDIRTLHQKISSSPKL
jgi:hypothetical protein